MLHNHHVVGHRHRLPPIFEIVIRWGIDGRRRLRGKKLFRHCQVDFSGSPGGAPIDSYISPLLAELSAALGVLESENAFGSDVHDQRWGMTVVGLLAGGILIFCML